jgi:hypothetical protein
VLAVSKVEQMESELRKLSQAELRQIREWLDGFIEDELEFTAEFAGERMTNASAQRLRFITRVSTPFPAAELDSFLLLLITRRSSFML